MTSKEIYKRNKEAAIEAGENKYEGKPCVKCGSTERYVVMSKCVSCMRINDRSPEKRQRQREYNKKKRATVEFKESYRRYTQRPEIKERSKERVAAKYGLTLQQYNRMFFLQKGQCAICSKVMLTQGGGTNDRVCIDHNHVTNAVRGLLCSGCNLMIGMAKDNPDVLRNAITYLETAA